MILIDRLLIGILVQIFLNVLTIVFSWTIIAIFLGVWCYVKGELFREVFVSLFGCLEIFYRLKLDTLDD